MVSGDILSLPAADLALLEALLRANGLPADDCPEQVDNFCAIYAGADLIAAGGLEPAGDCVLLRSVVVSEAQRGKGLAQRITDHLLCRAETEGRVAVYLLTETAAGYFPKLGFRAIDRAHVPQAIRQTQQFSSLCPDSASCLWLPLPRA